MILDRRATLALLVAGATGLTACAPRPNRRSKPRGSLNVTALNRGFPALRARATPARLNLGVLSLADGAVWCADSEGRYPLQNLCHAPIAAAALAEIDAGRLTMNAPISITDVDLSAPPSLINQGFAGSATLPAIDLIALAVQQGDDTAADVIMKHIGGPGAVTAWLQDKGVTELRIDRYEREIQPDMSGMASFRALWKDPAAFAAARDLVPPAIREAATQAYLRDPRDTTTGPAALDFLDRLMDGRLLTPASTRLLLRLMTETRARPPRLIAALPPSAILMHETGGAAADLGLSPATNDLGVITLEDGRRLAVVVLLAGSTATEAERDRLIADAGRLALRAFA